jgi:hypothetical protein
MRSITDVIRQFKLSWTDELSPERIADVCRENGMKWIESMLNPVVTIQIFFLQVLHGNTACTHMPHLAPWRDRLGRRPHRHAIRRLGQYSRWDRIPQNPAGGRSDDGSTGAGGPTATGRLGAPPAAAPREVGPANEDRPRRLHDVWGRDVGHPCSGACAGQSQSSSSSSSSS